MRSRRRGPIEIGNGSDLGATGGLPGIHLPRLREGRHPVSCIRLHEAQEGPTLNLAKALAAAILLAGVSPWIGASLTQRMTGDGHVRSWWLAAGIALAISIPSLLVCSSGAWSRLGAGGPLLIVGWRMGSYLAVLLLAGATKWPGDNFFAQSLLGCYFPFLVLESGFSIFKSSPPPTRE
jgi:hypothetical protein